MLNNIEDNQFTFESVASYLRDNLKNCYGNAWLEQALKQMKEASSQMKDFNYRKLLDYLKSKNIAYMSRPLGFIDKCVVPDIRNGKFCDQDFCAYEKATHTIHDLIRDMESRGFVIDHKDIFPIEHYLIYIRRNNLLTVKQTREWVMQALDYLCANNKKTTTDFLYLFKNTRLMRSISLPYAKLDKEALELEKEWNELISKLSYDDKSAIDLIVGEEEKGEKNENK